MNNVVNNLPITLEDILEAKKKIGSDIIVTNLIFADKLSKILGAEIYIKPENMQRVRSFKIRGALNKIYSLTEEERARGVIAPSAGNHAQGVAFAATSLNIKSTIVMPKTAPQSKITSTIFYGGEVILADGSTFDEAYDLAKKMADEKGATLVHAFDDPKVIAGQGTIGVEIIQELPNVDTVFVPIGGGGLISGIAIAIKSINPNVRIIGVEAENCPSMQESIKAGHPVKIKSKPTLADGIAVKAPSKLTLGIVTKLVDEIVTVSESEIKDAMSFLIEECKLVAEGAGAVATAAIISNKVDIKDRKVISLLTGGNIDTNKMIESLEKSLTSKGRRHVISIDFDKIKFSDFIEFINPINAKAYLLTGDDIEELEECSGPQKMAIYTIKRDEIDIISKWIKNH